MSATRTTSTASTRIGAALDHATAMRLAAVEYDRFADAVLSLEPSEWPLPTDCPDWDVRQLVCHTIGMATMASSPWQTLRQQLKASRRARATGVDPLTALTAVQVDERADWTPERIAVEVRRVGPRAVRGRRRVPAPVRDRTLPQVQLVGGVAEHWTIGFLNDVVLTRDPWMHRMDLARATGRSPVLTADHDGVIVADVVAEWSRRHRAPYLLTLTGRAGGTWTRGEDGAEIQLDAVDFCRLLAGRGTGEGLLSVQVPF